MKCTCLAVVLAALTCSHMSKADTLVTFNAVNHTYASGAKGTGTITIDTTTGTYVGLNYTYTQGTTAYLFTTISGQGTFAGSQYYFYSFDSAGDLLDLGVPGTSLVGYSGGPICTTATYAVCKGYGYVTPNNGLQDFQATGSLAVTPEPSTLLLLGSGLTLVWGAARKRTRLNA